MKIKFKIDHPSGIPKGTVREVNDKLGARMIEKKFAEATDEDVTTSPKKEFPKPDPGRNRNASNEVVAELTKAEKTKRTKLRKECDAKDIEYKDTDTIDQLEAALKLDDLKDQCEALKIDLSGDETADQLEELIKAEK